LTVEEFESRFSFYRIRELEIAETVAPWGEAAANLRMEYLANVIRAASDGYTKESREASEREAQRIWLRLFGPQPPKKPPKAADFVRG